LSPSSFFFFFTSSYTSFHDDWRGSPRSERNQLSYASAVFPKVRKGEVSVAVVVVDDGGDNNTDTNC
jgi:hypothetical protein